MSGTVPRYTYTAVNHDNQPVTGETVADTLGQAVASLESQGLRVETIETVPEETAAVASETALNDAVAKLVAWRDDLAPALSAYAAESPNNTRRSLLALQDQLTKGGEDQVRASARQSPEAWLPLLAAVTQCETPSAAFAHFLNNEQRDRTVLRRWGYALAYPFVVLLLWLLVAWPFATLLAPEFDAIFREFGLELPTSSRLMLSLGELLRSGGGLLLLLVALGGLALIAFGGALIPRRIRAGSLRSSQAARLAAYQLELGAPSSTPIDSAAVAYALSSSIPTRSRIALLRGLDASYGDRATSQAAWANGTLGPLAILVVGGFIGLAAISLFMPLLKLIGCLA